MGIVKLKIDVHALWPDDSVYGGKFSHFKKNRYLTKLRQPLENDIYSTIKNPLKL